LQEITNDAWQFYWIDVKRFSQIVGLICVEKRLCCTISSYFHEIKILPSRVMLINGVKDVPEITFNVAQSERRTSYGIKFPI